MTSMTPCRSVLERFILLTVYELDVTAGQKPDQIA
jgi:hypothetical protein